MPRPVLPVAILSIVCYGLIDYRSSAQEVTSVIEETTECLNVWKAQQEEIDFFVDYTQKPCNDFWEYACGNWRVPYKLRQYRATDTLTAIKAANKQILLQFFEDADSNAGKNSNHTELRVVKLYQSCLDKRAWKSKAQDEQSIRKYTNVLQNFSTLWPVLQRNFSTAIIQKNFNWEYVTAEMRRYGAQALMRVIIQENWQNSQQLIFYIMPPSFELLKARQSDATFDEESAYLYQRYIKLLMMDLGVRVRKANQIAEEVVSFEKALLSLATDERLLVLKEPQSLASLTSELIEIDLMKYFNTLLNDFNMADNFAEKTLIVADKVYLKKLFKFLDKSSAETIAKYLLVQFLAHFEVNLHDDDSYNKQKEDCLMQINDFMPSELTNLFLRLEHGKGDEFLEQTQKHLNNIFDNLKKQFEKLLNTTTVFERDPQTKVLGMEKIKAMRLLLPKVEASSEDELEFAISENYDENLINLSMLKNKKHIQEAVSHIVGEENKIVESNLSLFSVASDRSYGPLDVNAYYRLKKNAIELPIGILRTPLYNKCLKPARIYGSFVYILAHELIHGFDYDGLNYDKVGNVANGWGVKAIIKFGVKSNCYLNERYNNGHLTINENIADSEGLRLALETFLDSEITNNFKQEDLKLFFLSFAQTWCGSSNNKTNLPLHAGHKERVNNVLGNFMEFADIYKCQTGSEMHPEEKCRIW